MIAETRTMKALRNVVVALTLTLIGATSMANSSVAQAEAFSPTTTGVIVILTARVGVTREQIMAVMPAEIRETVQLYLNGKIREWYSRGDGRGVVFLLDTSDVAEATRSWRVFRWPRKMSWTTSTSESVHSCPSACSSSNPSAQQGQAPIERTLAG